ncbi:MAG: TonB-dependent receptor [Moraxellaceae bacterium]|nr:TonB-dependent receptor [Moraxellaceae bacterium]
MRSPSRSTRPARSHLAHALHALLITGALTTTLQALPAAAQVSEARRNFNVPAGSLEDALNAFARQAGITLSFDPQLARGKQATALSGNLTVAEGLSQLLGPHGLEATPGSTGSYAVRTRSGGEAVLPAVVVTAQHMHSPSELPAAYAGGQVARGGRIGALGNADFMDVPMSVVSFTDEFRDNIQALSVSDMLKYSVSAQTPQAGAVPTTDIIYVRGFNIGTYDGTFDGLPGLLGRMPPVEAVERVELLLGANAFANGQPGSVGGNINIVPKRAGDEPLLRIGANYRTESILGTTVDASRRFGPDNALGIRANLAYNDGDTELTNGERRNFARALAFDFRGKDTRFTLDYMGNNRRLPAETWFIINSGVNVPDAERASRDFRQPWAFYKDQWDTVVARGEWDFAPRWTVSAAYGRMWNTVERKSQVSEITNNAGDMQDAWGGSLGHSRQKRIVDSTELKVLGQFDTGPVTHRVAAGVGQWGEKSGYAGSYSATYIPFASNIYNPVHYPEPAIAAPEWPDGYTSRTRNSSLFLSDDIGFFNDRLHVLLGAREVKYKSESYNGSSWEGDPAKSKWSPAYGLLFKAQPWLSLYANRLESLDSGYEVQPPATNAGEVLPPLPSDQIEIGAKADFGKYAATIALFEINKASYMTDPGTGIEGSNGRQVNRGVELSFFGELTRGLRLYSSATFLDPKMEKTYGGTYDGKVAVSAAKFMANAYADWDVPGVAGLALLGGLSYSSSVYNDEANTQQLDPWTRVDLGVRYRTNALGKPATFRLTIDNVMDKQYFVSERGTIYFAPKRTIGAAVSFDL